MNENKNIVKSFAKTAAKSMIHREMFKWPPDCVGFTYQPKRPKRAKITR